MRMVVQRVKRVSLRADGVMHDEMDGPGLLVLVGLKEGDDDPSVWQYMMDKLVHLRILEDENQKMNLSVADKKEDLFLVPNFTLYGDCRHGRRPSFSLSAPVREAGVLFEKFLSFAAKYAQKEAGLKVHSGVFQADMQIETALDGPVTLLIDSEKTF